MVEIFKEPVAIVFTFMTISSVVSVAAYYWHKVSVAHIEAGLKADMVQRGMSADEIERVVRATAAESEGEADAATKPAARRA